MKTMIKNLVLIISITFNVYLVYKFIDLGSAGSSAPVQDTVVAKTPVLNQPSPESIADNSEQLNLRQPVDPSSDYLQYLDHLRQQDLSDLEIKQVLLARIDFEYKNLESQLTEEYRYWKRSERDRQQIFLQELAWTQEKRDILLELFGNSVVDDPIFEDLFKPLDEKLGFLSSDKQIALNELMLKNKAETSSIFGQGFIRESREDRQAANEFMLASIQELLSPQEFLEYQLRESRTANMMRRSMDGFDYGEQEFRDIFEIRQSSQLQPDLAGLNMRDPQVREEFRSDREESRNQTREYLGEERYQELARTQDPLYRSMQAIADRYGKSEQEIISAYEITTEARTKIDEIRRDQSLSSAQRRTGMQELNEQTLKDIQEVVGDEAAESIQRNTAQFRYGRSGRRGPR